MYYELVSNNGFYVLVGALKGEQFRTIKHAQGKKFKALSRTGGSANHRGVYIIGGLILLILAIALIQKQVTKKRKLI